MLKRLLLTISLLCFVVSFSGCAKRIQYFSEEGIDYGFYNTVALLPLENNSGDEYAAERFSDVLMTAVLKNGLFDVVEKGDLKLFMRNEVAGKDMTSIDKQAAAKMAKFLKVDAYIAGSVDGYEIVRSGSYSFPVISATLRVVDTNTGQVIWQANGSESGYSTSQRILGIASADMHQVSLRLVEKLLQTMK